MPEPPIRTWTDTDGVAHLRLGDGRRHNALPPPAWPAIAEWASAPATREATAVVVAGEGGAFCSGADLDAWRDAEVDEVAATFDDMEAACRALEALPVPTIAVIRGVALGAGCQLALACDLRLGDATARLGMPIVRLGILTGEAFAARLARSAPRSVATSLLLLGEVLDADAALRAGLLSHVVAAEAVDATVERWLDVLRGQPTRALREALVAVRSAGEGADAAPGAPRVDPQRFHRAIDEVLGSR